MELELAVDTGNAAGFGWELDSDLSSDNLAAEGLVVASYHRFAGQIRFSLFGLCSGSRCITWQ